MEKEINRISYLIIFSLFIINIKAQYSKAIIPTNLANEKQIDISPIKSAIQITKLSGETNYKIDRNWAVNFKNLEIKHSTSESVIKIKSRKTKDKINDLQNYQNENEFIYQKSAITPIVSKNFAGNQYTGGYPPDNCLAISNNGYIVSAINSNINYYDTIGTLLYSSSFDNFFNDTSLTSSIYDPVIIYDSDQDRFSMAVLHGNSSSTSKLIVCFSKTNDPLDGWWVYKLNGNPLNDASWFDYPKIGVSTNEIYVSGNLFYDAGGFNETVLYQIPKANGYLGASLTWQHWSNITDSPFTLVPISYGQHGSYGPGVYLINTDEDGAFQDKLRFYDLTDDMSGSPSINAYSIDVSFALAGDALQLGTAVTLDNGDNRGLNAFYLNGVVHFVYSDEYTNNYNGISYNRIDVASLTNTNKKFGLNGYDYSYPAVMSFSQSATDKSVIVAFLRSSSSIYPQIRVVHCDDNMDWSSSVSVKNGDSYTDNGQTTQTRWGDYIGIGRKHNSNNNELWVGAQYGTMSFVQGIGNSHCLETWIAQITDVVLPPPPTNITTNIPNKTSIFPNPIYDMMNIQFHLSANSEIKISIFDINGRFIKLLYRDNGKKGENLISFNKAALSKGIYYINIESNNILIKNEKVIIQ